MRSHRQRYIKVDSAIVNMGQQIAEDFKKIMKR